MQICFRCHRIHILWCCIGWIFIGSYSMVVVRLNWCVRGKYFIPLFEVMSYMSFIVPSKSITWRRYLPSAQRWIYSIRQFQFDLHVNQTVRQLVATERSHRFRSVDRDWQRPHWSVRRCRRQTHIHFESNLKFQISVWSSWWQMLNQIWTSLISFIRQSFALRPSWNTLFLSNSSASAQIRSHLSIFNALQIWKLSLKVQSFKVETKRLF